MDVPNLTALLREAKDHHSEYDATAPKHDWPDSYAAYIVARQDGSSPEESARAAGRHIDELLR
jgi:hypothetical protein